MRYFNDTEKEVIDYICDVEPTSDVSTIKKLFEKKCDCSMLWNNDILTIYIKHPSSDKTNITKILNIICLLDYLKSEGLIYLFRNMRDSYSLINKEHDHIALNKKWDDTKFEKGEILPGINVKMNENNAQIALNPFHLSKDISKKIFDYFNCSFFCSDTLRHIKNQDYKDDATIQYENNRCQTWWAIGVSFLVGIVGIIGTFMTYFQNERFHREDMEQQSQKNIIIPDSTIVFNEECIEKNPTTNQTNVTSDTLNYGHK